MPKCSIDTKQAIQVIYGHKTIHSVWVSGAGNLAITGSDGSTATLESVAAGTLIKVRFCEIGDDTTATKITLLY